MTAADTLVLSLRESRLILERLVQAAGVPPGLLPAVRDCALASAALPGPGFAGIAAQIERLRRSRVQPLTVLAEAPDLVVGAAGQHAWLVADALLDLAVERQRCGGDGAVVAAEVAAPEELRVVAALAERYGLDAEAEAEGARTRLRVHPRPAAAPTLLDHIRRSGIATTGAVWWPLYHASHAALAPDSFESRRHAGTVRVEADGRVVGRNDEDETDLAMLAADPGRLRLPATSPEGPAPC